MAADWTNDPPFVGPTRHVGCDLNTEYILRSSLKKRPKGERGGVLGGMARYAWAIYKII